MKVKRFLALVLTALVIMSAVSFSIPAAAYCDTAYLSMTDDSIRVQGNVSLKFNVTGYSSTQSGYVTIYPKAGYEACVAADCNGELKVDGKVQYIDYYNMGTAADNKIATFPTARLSADFVAGETYYAVLNENDHMLTRTAIEFEIMAGAPTSLSLVMNEDSVLTHDGLSLSFTVNNYTSDKAGYVTIYPKAGYEACVAADCNGELRIDGKAQYIDYYNVGTPANGKVATFPTARLSADFVTGETYVAVVNENDRILTETALEFTVTETPLTLTLNEDSVLTHDDIALNFTVNGYKSTQAGYVTIYPKAGYEACVAADCNGELRIDGKAQYIDYYNLGTTAAGKVATFPTARLSADFIVGETYVAVVNENDRILTETALEFTVEKTPLTLTLNKDSVLTHDDLALSFTVNGYKSTQTGYVSIYTKDGYEACVAADCDGEHKVDGKVQYIDYYNLGTTAVNKVIAFPTSHKTADYAAGETYVAVVGENTTLLPETAVEFTVKSEGGPKLTLNEGSDFTRDGLMFTLTVSNYISTKPGYVNIYTKEDYETCVAADCNGELKVDGAPLYFDYFSIQKEQTKVVRFPNGQGQQTAEYKVGVPYVAVLMEGSTLLPDTAFEFTVTPAVFSLVLNEDSDLRLGSIALKFTVDHYASAEMGYVSIFPKAGYEACVAADCNGEHKVNGKVQYIDYYNVGKTAAGKIATFPTARQSADYVVGETYVAVLVEGEKMYPATAIEFTVKNAALSLTMNEDSNLIHDTLSLGFTVNGYSSTQYGYVMIYPKGGYEACVAADCNGEYKVDGKVQYIDYYNVNTTANGKVATFPSTHKTADYAAGETFVAVLMEGETLIPETAIEFTVLKEAPPAPAKKVSIDKNEVYETDVAVTVTVDSSFTSGWVGIYSEAGYAACVADNNNANINYLDWRPLTELPAKMPTGWASRNVNRVAPVYTPGVYYVALADNSNRLIPGEYVTFTVKSAAPVDSDAVAMQWKDMDKGYLSFVFDDNREDSLPTHYAVMQEYGFPLCAAIPSATLPRNIDLLHEIENHGGEILSHTKNHYTLNPSSGAQLIDDQLRLSKEELEAEGFNVNGVILAGGTGEDKSTEFRMYIEPFTAKYYLYSDWYGVAPQYYHPRDHFSGRTVDEIKAIIDGTIAAKTWTVIYAHGLDECSEETLRAVLDYVTEKKAEGKLDLVTYKYVFENLADWEEEVDFGDAKYTVDFYGNDGKTLLASSVTIDGESAAAPTDYLLKEGASFTGWDTSFDKVTGNLKVNALVSGSTGNAIFARSLPSGGTYTVCGGKTAYLLDEAGTTLYAGSGTVTVPCGGTLYFGSSIDDAGVPTPEAPEGMVFDHWAEDNGAYKAVFIERIVKEGEYYVMYGGTGDGRSADKPAGSIPDVIASLNADGLTTGDTATLYVMNAPDSFTYCPDVGTSRNVPHHLTSWKVPAHYDATLVITGYEGTGSYLAVTPYFCDTDDMKLMGPTVIENISIAMMRVYDSSIDANGYDCEIKNSAVFCRFPKDNGPYVWDGTFNTFGGIIKTGNNYPGGEERGKGGTMILNGKPTDIRLPAARDDNYTYTEDQTIYFNDYTDTVTIKWAGVSNTTYGANLNLVINGTGEISNVAANTTGSVTVKGGLQIVNNGNVSINALPENVHPEGGLWVMNAAGENGTLALTDTAGRFKVESDLTAVASSASTGEVYYSADGYLTVPADTYQINYATVDDNLKADIRFDGEENGKTYLKGFDVILPRLDNKADSEFIGWSYNGTTYFAGDAFFIPADLEGTINFVSIWEAITGSARVYVDEKNGSDNNSGATAGEALATLDKAFAVIASRTADDKRVIIVGEYHEPEYLPAHDEMIVICGDGSGNSAFHYAANDGASMDICGPTTFENIALIRDTNWKFINTSDHELVLGEGLTLSNVSIHFGHEDGADSGFQKFTIKSGTVDKLLVGTHYVSGSNGKYEGCEVIVDGGTINTVQFGSDAYLDSHKGTDFTGNLSFRIYSGSIGSFTSRDGANAPVFKAGVSVSYFNGTTGSFPLVEAEGGTYTFKYESDGSDNILEQTDKGVFKVISSENLTAIASAENAKYASSEGYITLPSGSYDVTFTDKLFYLNTGDTITVYEDCALDLSNEAHNTVEGKLFLGWAEKDEEGIWHGVMNGETLPAGTVLYARYTDYEPAYNERFYAEGAQIRTNGVQGLRFVFRQDADFMAELPETGEFGAIVLPGDIVMGKEILLDTEVNGYVPARVKAEKIFEENDAFTRYTLCITDITEPKYQRYYAVKGYLMWTDYNGVERVLYTNVYQTNLYAVARAALNDTSASYDDSALSTLGGICDAVEITARNAYFAANYGNETDDPTKAAKITLLSGYPTTSDTDPRHAMYALANGLRVREVNIDSGTGGDDVTIVQFADTHFNYYNSRDLEEANPALMSTIQYRTWNSGGSSAIKTARADEYANWFDKAVVTGDTMDYLAWGAYDMMSQMLQMRLYNGKVVVGNHEDARQMQGTVPDTKTIQENYDFLQSIWPDGENIFYSSEILKNDDGMEKVMLIYFYNSTDVYFDFQVTPFANDLAAAREKGIPVLIFEHDPICTRNPKETAVSWIYEPGDTSGIPYDFSSRFAGAPGSKYTGATKTVYEMITNNGDLIKGIFCGHLHNHIYTEIVAKTASGEDTVIPQYLVSANAYGDGSVIRINVK